MNLTEETRRAVAQAMITDDMFGKIVTNLVPKVMQEEIGNDSFAPELIVVLGAPAGERHEWVVCKYMVDLEEDTLKTLLSATGAKMAQQKKMVVAAVLSSEAWLKTMTPEQEAQRGNRAVSTYEDKEEVIIVAGKTLDRRAMINVLTIERDDQSNFSSFTPRRDKQKMTVAEMPVLDAFFEGYIGEILSKKQTASDAEVGQ